MQRYVAFLRAINVGGHTVKMERLRSIFESLGFTGVRTFIASGNVIFDSPAADADGLEEQIEAHLKEALGYQVGTFLRSTSEVAAIAAYQPFEGPDPVTAGHALSVLFLKAAPGDDVVRQLGDLRTETDEFHARGREVYWLCRTRISDSPAGMLLGKALGKVPATTRNVTTVRKLAAKYASPE
jgi:uncharacterized protein (DUF1697 family)